MNERKKDNYNRMTISSLPEDLIKILEDRRKRSGLSRSNQAKMDLMNPSRHNELSAGTGAFTHWDVWSSLLRLALIKVVPGTVL
jgi:hypothetical protein